LLKLFCYGLCSFNSSRPTYPLDFQVFERVLRFSERFVCQFTSFDRFAQAPSPLSDSYNLFLLSMFHLYTLVVPTMAHQSIRASIAQLFLLEYVTYSV
jgi:hypothetical protein